MFGINKTTYSVDVSFGNLKNIYLQGLATQAFKVTMLILWRYYYS